MLIGMIFAINKKCLKKVTIKKSNVFYNEIDWQAKVKAKVIITTHKNIDTVFISYSNYPVFYFGKLLFISILVSLPT